MQVAGAMQIPGPGPRDGSMCRDQGGQCLDPVSVGELYDCPDGFTHVSGDCPDFKFCCIPDEAVVQSKCQGSGPSAQCVFSNGNEGFECSTDQNCIIQGHTECIWDETNSDHICATVAGLGENQCNFDDNCDILEPSHSECVGVTCELFTGQGFDECNTDENCNGSHRECQGLQCVTVYTSGMDQCNSDQNCEAAQFILSVRKNLVANLAVLV